jgi:predicted Fe-Mo cluster-binding NifX family protein
MSVKVAIPIWGGRVSPVMDTACRLLIAEITGSREVSRTIIDIPQLGISHRASFVSGLGIDLLICGAISHEFEQMLIASGVKMCPWYCGNVDEIIAAHSNGTLQRDNFFLPGRALRRRRGNRGQRRAGCPRSGIQGMFEEDQ